MEAFVVVTKPVGKLGKRFALVGYARVELLGEAVDGTIKVKALAKSTPEILDVFFVERVNVFATPVEQSHFGELVGWFQEGIPCGERPEVTNLNLPLVLI